MPLVVCYPDLQEMSNDVSNDNLRSNIFSSFTNGDSIPRLTDPKMGPALRAAGLFPTESFLSSVPEEARHADGFARLEVPTPSMALSEAFLAFDPKGSGSISEPALLFALQGPGEPLPDEIADEILRLAREKCMKDNNCIEIRLLTKCIHEFYGSIAK